MINLTKDDWVEIYYALESKRVAVEVGQDRKWLAHLEKIIQEIGPDGETAFEEAQNYPRLLEACKAIVDQKESTLNKDVFEIGRVSVERVRKAMAKVEGKPDHE